MSAPYVVQPQKNNLFSDPHAFTPQEKKEGKKEEEKNDRHGLTVVDLPQYAHPF